MRDNITAMSEEGKSKWDQGFESFMGDVRRRTEPGRQESPRDVLAEVRENSIDGFQSHEEATAALARVQLVVEKAEEEQDDALTDEGKELEADIKKGYPDLED